MPAKRAKKKTARKRAPRKKSPNKTKRTGWLFRILVLIIVCILIVSGIYYFGSFETRAKMDQAAISAVNSIRTHEKTPGFIAGIFDLAHDAIPSSEGLVVEGSELGRDPDIPLIAGMPNSRFPIRVLTQPSYINLFNEQNRQASCIALRLDSSASKKADASDQVIIDSRVPNLNAPSMALGQWSPFPIAPPAALIDQNGERGASDAQLATNHAPMDEAFYKGVWRKAMRELTQRYPKRFGELWIYLGPLYRPDSSKLSSGIAIPDAFYAIAFDLTEEGGLRALTLVIPVDAESKNLNNYLSSIAQVEKLSGLQFLPELDFSLRDTLGNYVSPNVW